GRVRGDDAAGTELPGSAALPRPPRRGRRDLRGGVFERLGEGGLVGGGGRAGRGGDVAHRVLGERGDRQRRVHADVRGHGRAVAHQQVLVAEDALARV